MITAGASDVFACDLHMTASCHLSMGVGDGSQHSEEIAKNSSNVPFNVIIMIIIILIVTISIIITIIVIINIITIIIIIICHEGACKIQLRPANV